MNTGPQQSASPEFWRLWKVTDVARALGMSRTYSAASSPGSEMQPAACNCGTGA
ncbi:MAG: hypothetical protein ACLQDQ_00110 [Myxococcaceae bacterium]